MSKVCRVLTSVELNQKKYGELEVQAKLLGKLRKEIWQRQPVIFGRGWGGEVKEAVKDVMKDKSTAKKVTELVKIT